MKLIYSICLVAFSFFTVVYGQEMQKSFSDKMRLKPSKTGLYRGVLGETEKSIIVEYKNTNRKGVTTLERIGIIDKRTMKEGKTLKIVDSKDANRKKEIGDREMAYVRLVDDEKLFVFYTDESKTEVNLYAECYGINLSKQIKMKKLLTIKKNSKRDVKRPIALVNKKEILIAQLDNTGNAFVFDYKVLDFSLSETSQDKVELPTPESANDGSVFSINNFILGNNGIVYFNQSLAIKAGKQKVSLFLKTDAYKHEFYLTSLRLESGEANLIDMNAPEKSLMNVHLYEKDGDVKILGFFCDFEKDPSGIRTHGIFYRNLDEETLEASEIVFSYFGESLLNDLFKADTEDKLKTRSKKKNKAENEERDKEALSRSFTIERISSDASGNLILFCSKMYNYSVTTCTSNSNGGQTCTTRYYCQKSNVTAFKIDNSGEFVWASNIDRLYTYSGTSIYDVNVIEDEENYYVSYANAKNDAFDTADEEDTKKKKKGKTKNETYDYFEYGVINKETGSNEQKTFVINEPDMKKADKKYCNASSIQVFNNQFFLVSKRNYRNPLIYLTCLCPPAFIVAGMMNAGYAQDIYVGKIQLKD